MGRQRSKLELLMREIGSALQMGFQFYYCSHARHRRKSGTPGRWSIEIWDQRPGHYARATKKDPTGYDVYKKKIDLNSLKAPGNGFLIYEGDGPWQKWHNNQHSDYREMLDDIVVDKCRKWTKDEFIEYMLFEDEKFFQAFPWLKCSSLDQLIFKLEIAGRDTTKILKLLKDVRPNNRLLKH